MITIIKNLIAKIEELEKENKELKEQLTILDDEAVVVEITAEQFEEYKKLKAENEELKNNDVFSIRLFKDKADKYEQTLKEIKKILLFHKEELEEFLPNDIGGKILQKISEVEDVENN